MSYNILIVDDSAFVRHSLRSCIEQNADWIVCGEAENGQIAIEKVKELHPDVVLLDLAMPVMNGLEAARLIRALAPDTTMLMFTLHSCAQLVNEAHAAGIIDVVSKSEGLATQLLASLSSICAA